MSTMLLTDEMLDNVYSLYLKIEEVAILHTTPGDVLQKVIKLAEVGEMIMDNYDVIQSILLDVHSTAQIFEKPTI